MYYRVAIQADASPAWQWKSTTLSSLNALFQLLRRYRNLSQDHLRVFSSSSREEIDEQRPSLNESSSGTGVPDERQSSSPENRRVVLERGVGGDFWNLMALAKA